MSWTQQTAKGQAPSCRASMLACYDEQVGRIVIFGGNGVRADGTGGSLADTWEYDGTTWTQVSTTPRANAPALGALVYDSARNRRVLIGATHTGGVYSASLLIWKWDGTNWVQQPASWGNGPPGSLTGYSAVYDPDRQQIILNNGWTLSGWPQETYGLDHFGWRLLPTGPGPHGYMSGGLVYDAVRHSLVQFGGADNNFFIGGETWEMSRADAPFILKSPPNRETHRSMNRK